MNSKDSDLITELRICKKQLLESEKECKEIYRDYLDLVKRFNRVELENKRLNEEIIKLRKTAYGRKDNS